MNLKRSASWESHGEFTAKGICTHVMRTLTALLSGHPKQYSCAAVEKQTAGDFPPHRSMSERRLASRLEVGTAFVLLTFHSTSKRLLQMLLLFTYLLYHLFWHASHIRACLCNSMLKKKSKTFDGRVLCFMMIGCCF